MHPSALKITKIFEASILKLKKQSIFEAETKNPKFSNANPNPALHRKEKAI